VALGLGLGALAGGIWEAVVDLPIYTLNADSRALTSERGLTAIFGADAWFCLIGAVAGLLLGAVAWWRLRGLGWPVVPVTTVAAVAAALVAWWVGTALGPADFATRLATAVPGDVVPVGLALRAPVSLLVWPFFAVAPILLASSLGRDEEEPAEPDEPAVGPDES
jgi:hypothetical protein